MASTLRRLLLFSVSLWLCASAMRAGERFAFRHVGMESGLAHERVNSVCSGRRGFLWLSTQWGLDCYDGYSVSSFAVPDSVLRGGEVLGVQEFGADSMLVRLSNGFALFSRNNLTFSDADSFLRTRGAVGRVLGAWVDGRQSLWLMEADRVVYSSASGGSFSFPLPAEVDVSCVSSSRYGLAILLADGRTLRCSPPPPGAEPAPQVFSSPIKSGARVLRVDLDGDLWVVSSGGDSLWHKPMSGSGWELLNGWAYWNDDVPRDIVDVSVDSRRRVWLVSRCDGACVVDPLAGSVTPLRRSAASPLSLRSNFCTCVKALRSGAVVIGYQHSGFSVYHPSAFKFAPLSILPRSLQESVSDVRSVETDSGRFAYIGTNGGGILRVDVRTREAVALPFAKSDVAESLAALPDGSLWAFVAGRGFARYGETGWDAASPGVSYFGGDGRVPDPLNSTSSAGVVAKSRSGCLWAAAGRRLVALPNAAASKDVFAGCAVATLEDDVVAVRAGRDTASVLVLTRSSFFSARLSDDAIRIERLTDYNLRADHPMDVCVGVHGFYWVGLSSGVAMFSRQDSTGLVRLIRVIDLPQPVIALAAEPHGGVVAVGPSEAHIFRVYPSSSSADGYRIVAGRYSQSSGLLAGVNSPRATSAMPLGGVWIGAENGVNEYLPVVDDDSPVPPVSFSRLSRDGMIVMPGESIGGVCPLDRAIPLCESITLPCHNGSFTLDFSVLGVSSPECYMYSCEIRGADLPAATSFSPSFHIPDLPAGSYVLSVVAIDPEGRKSERAAELTLVFFRPWYESAAARVCMAAALALISLMLAYRFGAKRWKRRHPRQSDSSLVKSDVLATLGESSVVSTEMSSIVLKAVAANVSISIDALSDDIRALSDIKGVPLTDSFAIRNLSDRLMSANAALAAVAGDAASDELAAPDARGVGRHDIVAVCRTIVRQVAAITHARQSVGFSTPLRNCVLGFDLEAFRLLLIDVVVDAIVSMTGQGFVRVMVEMGKYGPRLVSVSVSIGGVVPTASLYFMPEAGEPALPQNVEACLDRLGATMQTRDFGDGMLYVFIHIPMGGE